MSLGDILEAWQAVEMSDWGNQGIHKALNEDNGKHRQRRSVMFSATGVGGNAKTGIKYYGKGATSLEVSQLLLSVVSLITGSIHLTAVANWVFSGYKRG